MKLFAICSNPDCRFAHADSDYLPDFCNDCGTAMLHACPYCGNSLRGKGVFCMDCGQRLKTEPTPDAAPEV